MGAGLIGSISGHQKAQYQDILAGKHIIVDAVKIDAIFIQQ
jgi:hypothetical protein